MFIFLQFIFRAGPNRYLLGELDDQGQLVGLDEGQDVLLGHLSVKGVAALVELEKHSGTL